jgi:D-arabinose 1-dehydrogenase-like Zn-dependent alcohol dehydrogenase
VSRCRLKASAFNFNENLVSEIVGTIAAKGEAVTYDCADRPLAVGDRITWTLMDNCGKCYYGRQKG